MAKIDFEGRGPVAPTVAIIVVNFNGRTDTVECVRSLQRLLYPALEIVVVDNASSDGSVEELRIAVQGITTIPLNWNSGFAGGCNVGMRYALRRGVDYVWLVNNDAVVVESALSQLVHVAQDYPDRRFFGSWITHYDHPDRLWFGGGTLGRLSGRIGTSLWNEQVGSCPGRGQVVETTWITGCSLLVRTAGLTQIGLLDEAYFLYVEDLEWQLRASGGNPRAMMLCTELVRHKVGKSTGSTNGFLGRLFMSRNYLKLARGYARFALPIWLLRWAGRYLLFPLLRCQPRLAQAGLLGLLLQRTEGAEIVRRFGDQ